jgi:hypothetical protein
MGVAEQQSSPTNTPEGGWWRSSRAPTSDGVGGGGAPTAYASTAPTLSVDQISV